MRVFKSTYTAPDGTTRQTRRWYVEVRDQNGKQRRLAAFKLRAPSETLGRRIEQLVALKVAGMEPEGDLAKWLAGVQGRLLARLAEWGLASEAALPLRDHLAAFEKSVARRATKRHAKQHRKRVAKVLAGCAIWPDVSASHVERRLLELRDDGLAPSSVNAHLAAAKQFARWMVERGLASRSPLAPLKPLRAHEVQAGRKRIRRALTRDEMRELVAHTESAPDRYGIPGYERATLYRLAMETGLRAGEIRSLTPRSFTLDTDPPTVTVEAAYSKRRREDVLPLTYGMAQAMVEHLALVGPGAKAFRMPAPTHVARMLRGDLEAAGIDAEDDSGRVVDFHALRHTFVTNLARSGVHPKVAQSLARHSTITLTMDRYAHTALDEETDAIRGASPFTGSHSGSASNSAGLAERQRTPTARTGTDDAETGGGGSGGGTRTPDTRIMMGCSGSPQPKAGKGDRSTSPYLLGDLLGDDDLDGRDCPVCAGPSLADLAIMAEEPDEDVLLGGLERLELWGRRP